MQIPSGQRTDYTKELPQEILGNCVEQRLSTVVEELYIETSCGLTDEILQKIGKWEKLKHLYLGYLIHKVKMSELNPDLVAKLIVNVENVTVRGFLTTHNK